MKAVPVVSTVIIGLVCMGLLWLSLLGGAGLGIHDQEDFDYASMAISEMQEHNIERGSDLSYMEELLDSNHMALQIVSDGEVFFQYGTKTEDDEKLLSAARALDGSCTVTLDGRSLYF